MSAETTSKCMELVLCWKKRVSAPTSSKSSIFPLLKDFVHTPEYTNTLNLQQVIAADCSDQLIYAIRKMIQSKYSVFAFPKYFTLFGALHIKEELLIAHGHLVAGTGLNEIVGHTPIDTADLQTTTVDVNHVPKARFFLLIICCADIHLLERSSRSK